MEVPSMAVGGVVPTLSPLLLFFILIAVAGGLMLGAALMLRNLRLMRSGRLNPFNPAHLQIAADPTVTTRPPGAPKFSRSTYGRTAIGLLMVGGSGVVLMLLAQLFAG